MLAMVPAGGEITLDGRLDEPAWAQAVLIPELTQKDPHPGEPTAYRTEVRMLRDKNHIYIGIICKDPAMNQVAVHTLQRDADQSNDDHVTLVLDTFGSRRIGYVFQVNAGGARADGLISPANTTPDFDWNGLWDAEVIQDAEGWTAEIAIDSRSLQFSDDLDRWGLNLQRYVPREQLSLQWAGISLDSSIFDLQRAGALTGMAGLRRGSGLEISPYGLVREDSVAGASKSVGAEFRYNPKPDLAAILTLNPDFAEAEADAEQVNLTQFALFFPEKRPFFLEGSNQFAFSAGLGSSFVPFYSRRIGLAGSTSVRIDEGLKVIGEAGPVTIGALGVHTGQAGDVAPQNLLAARLAYDADSQLQLGTLVTHGDPSGKTDNGFTGIDGVWQTPRFLGDKNMVIAGWAGRSSGNSHGGQSTGWGLYFDTPNDLWRLLASANVYGDALDPALGFLPRPGTRQYELYGEYKPRPHAGVFDWVRQFDYQLDYQQVDSSAGITQSRIVFIAPFNAHTSNGAHMELDVIPEYEAVTTPFPVAPAVTIPAGTYDFQRYLLQLGSSPADAWQVGTNIETGTFYDGRLTQFTPYIDWSTGDGRVQLQLSTETDLGHLLVGSFALRLRQLKLAYSFSPDLSLSSFIQYDSTLGHTGINTTLHWIPVPGRDLFIVLNHGIETSPVVNTASTAPLGNVVIVKLRWDFET